MEKDCLRTMRSLNLYSSLSQVLVCLQGGRGQMYDEFIGSHHDGCVWDLADQVSQEPSV